MTGVFSWFGRYLTYGPWFVLSNTLDCQHGSLMMTGPACSGGGGVHLVAAPTSNPYCNSQSESASSILTGLSQIFHGARQEGATLPPAARNVVGQPSMLPCANSGDMVQTSCVLSPIFPLPSRFGTGDWGIRDQSSTKSALALHLSDVPNSASRPTQTSPHAPSAIANSRGAS